MCVWRRLRDESESARQKNRDNLAQTQEGIKAFKVASFLAFPDIDRFQKGQKLIFVCLSFLKILEFFLKNL